MKQTRDIERARVWFELYSKFKNHDLEISSIPVTQVITLARTRTCIIRTPAEAEVTESFQFPDYTIRAKKNDIPIDASCKYPLLASTVVTASKQLSPREYYGILDVHVIGMHLRLSKGTPTGGEIMFLPAHISPVPTGPAQSTYKLTSLLIVTFPSYIL